MQQTHEFHRQTTMRQLRKMSREMNDLAFELMEYPEEMCREQLIQVEGMLRGLRVGLHDLRASDEWGR